MNKIYVGIFLVVMFGAGIGIAVLSSTGGENSGSVQQSANEPIPPKTIAMTANGYTPGNLEVKVGDTVTFTNRDSEEHWPASNDHPSHKIYSDLDPKRGIPAGENWSFTFTKAGTWGMHDHLFPNMRATVVVEP